MKNYIAFINTEYPTVFANIFLVRANNKTEATNKVYGYCKDSWGYKKKEIIIQDIQSLYNTDEFLDVVEIN